MPEKVLSWAAADVVIAASANSSRQQHGFPGIEKKERVRMFLPSWTPGERFDFICGAVNGSSVPRGTGSGQVFRILIVVKSENGG